LNSSAGGAINKTPRSRATATAERLVKVAHANANGMSRMRDTPRARAQQRAIGSVERMPKLPKKRAPIRAMLICSS